MSRMLFIIRTAAGSGKSTWLPMPVATVWVSFMVGHLVVFVVLEGILYEVIFIFKSFVHF